MSVVRYSWRIKSLGGAATSTPRANYYLCDTEAEQPATAIEGDLCYTKDSNKLWRRSESAWVDASSGGAPATHATSHQSGGSDALTLNSLANPVASVQFSQQQALQFRVENRTSDPGAPAVGEVWLRTDL